MDAQFVLDGDQRRQLVSTLEFVQAMRRTALASLAAGSMEIRISGTKTDKGGWSGGRTMVNGEEVTSMAQKETYPVDLDPGQIVRWIKTETEADPSAFRINARRAREVREIPARREIRFGDEEREDLSEIATVGTLEIRPAHASDGWQLTVIVEDEVGPRLLDEGGLGAEEQQIDLATFYKEFIRPERGAAYALAEVDGSAARARMTRLLNAIEQNRHSKSNKR